MLSESFGMNDDFDPEIAELLFHSREDHYEFSGCDIPIRESPDESFVPVDGQNFYELLKVAPSAGKEEIESAFSVEMTLLKRSAMPSQPPVYAEQAALMKLKLKRARDTLSYPASRHQHDVQLAGFLGREYGALVESDKRFGTVVLEEFLWSKGFVLTDKRDKDGALWITASLAFAPLFDAVLAMHGDRFQFGSSRKQRGWWTRRSRLLV